MPVPLIMLFTLLLLALPGHAGVLSGVLQDSLSNKPVAGVQLICLGTANGQRHLARTDDNGAYRFEDLPAGSYWLAAAHSAYFSKRVENVGITAKGTTRQDLQLVPIPEGFRQPLPLATPDAALLEPPRSQELGRSDTRAKRPASRTPLRSWDDLKLKVYGWLMDKVGGGSESER